MRRTNPKYLSIMNRRKNTRINNSISQKYGYGKQSRINKNINDNNPFNAKTEEGTFYDAELPQELSLPVSSHTAISENYPVYSYSSKLIYIYRTLYLLFNIIVLAFVILVICLFVWFVSQDINRLILQHKEELSLKRDACEEDYFRYSCGTSSVRPALIKECERLKECSTLSVDSLPIAQLTAKAIALIINSFFSELSYKALIFLVFFLISGLIFNSLFGLQFHERPVNNTVSSHSTQSILAKKDRGVELTQKEYYESSVVSSRSR